ncbi:MAG: hypothetical protein B9S26_12515 [Opitutia bacterium Tous-C4FEB]|nr:MAG: hypothetical protein B9S35_12830 [Opitutae bacterium Tous-C5TDCM]PAW88134.1 MAG: hypothetical protein B9S26_12515 [Opitutae bacterium Tous-C4FEB]
MNSALKPPENFSGFGGFAQPAFPLMSDPAPVSPGPDADLKSDSRDHGLRPDDPAGLGAAKDALKAGGYDAGEIHCGEAGGAAEFCA